MGLIVEEPAPAVRRRALRAVDDAGGLAGELLPDGVDQEHGAVAVENLAAGIANRERRFPPTSQCIVGSQRRMLSPARDRLGEQPRNTAACSSARTILSRWLLINHLRHISLPRNPLCLTWGANSFPRICSRPAALCTVPLVYGGLPAFSLCASRFVSAPPDANGCLVHVPFENRRPGGGLRGSRSLSAAHAAFVRGTEPAAIFIHADVPQGHGGSLEDRRESGQNLFHDRGRNGFQFLAATGAEATGAGLAAADHSGGQGSGA